MIETANNSINHRLPSPVLTTAITPASEKRSYLPLGWLDQCLELSRIHRGKLYGRDNEISQINNAYQNVKALTRSGVVLISGTTGIGKTGLARLIQNQVDFTDCNNGYFVVGKYDQIQRPEPHSALVEAFTQLILQMIECGYSQELCDALSQQGIDYECYGQDLLEMIPALKAIIKPIEVSPTKEETQSGKLGAGGMSNGVSTNRWKDLFRLFLRAVSSMQKPLVLLIEDLHWADETSLDVLQTLLQDKINTGTLFVCTFRTEKECTSPTLERIVKDLKQHEVKLVHFRLSTIPVEIITNMLVNLLTVNQIRAKPLASLIYGWTNGNILLVWKYIHGLRFKNLLAVDPATGHFLWDINKIEVEMNSINDLLKYKIQSLPEKSQEHLKMASCLGSKLDVDILLRLFSSNKEVISAFLDDVTSTHLVSYDESRASWCFSHDYFQEVTYHLIPEKERHVYHYRIGRKLWREFDLNELSDFLFLVVGQLLLGIDCINDHREQVAVAKLCLGAGVRACKLSNFYSSYNYLQSGISLLGQQSWDDEYDLMINLYNAAAEVANALGRFNDVHMLVNETIVHSKTDEDSHRARATEVQALGRSGKLEEAITTALIALDTLGEPFPENRGHLRTFAEISLLRWRVRGKSNEMIMRLPVMTDPKKLAAMEMMNLIFFYTTLVKPELTLSLGCRMVRLSLDHGLSAYSCIGFVVFAAAVAGIGQAFHEANRLGTLGFSLLQQFNATPWFARISDVYYDSVFCWVRPFSASCVPLLEAYNVGLQSGDTEFALACAIGAWFIKLEIEPLSESEHEMDRLLERIKLYGLKNFEHISLSSRHMIKELLGCYDGDINELKRKILDDNAYVLESNQLLLSWKYVHRAFKLYLFGMYDEAIANARAGHSIAVPFYGPYRGSVVALICGLVDVAYARQMKCKRAPYAKKYSKLMFRWATMGEPRNFIGRHYLLEAEIAAMLGKKSKSYRLYISAIGALREGNFLLYTAIATERIAKSLHEWGEYELARPYFNDAAALYAKWGATMKIQHLELEIQQLGIYN